MSLFDFFLKPKQKIEDLFYDDDRISEIDHRDFFDGERTCMHGVSLSECSDSECVEEWDFRRTIRDNPGKSYEEILRLLGDIE